jgi:glycosyltransferase involved in cell wall biosynthesis
MRIGIDGRALTGRFTGDRTYWLNLLRALLSDPVCAREHEFFVYSRLPIAPGTLPGCPNVTIRTVPASNNRLWTLRAFPRALCDDRIELAHTQYTTPLRAPCPVVTTVHDISFRLYPEWFPRKHRVLLNLTVPAAMRRAVRVITDSGSSRRDILRVYRLPDEKVEAIPLAAAPEFHPIPQETARQIVKDRFRIASPFALSVGVLQPRKNISLLIEAFALARHQCTIDQALVLTGKRGWGFEGLTRQAARLKVSDYILFTDYVPDEDLPVLYSAADAVAYPSLYEGFGLPPVEAMACGAPTLVSDRPCMPETVGHGAWILPALDAVPWGEAMARLSMEPELREHWSRRGIARAGELSWTQTARRTLGVYLKAMETV